MTIEGLGKKFQEARIAKQLTLEEAARLTKIRPSRLAEIEADDFSQFPSLAYAKGFLLIYGKFLDVDVTPYLEAFEGSSNVTVDGYSYLQETPAPRAVRTPVIRAPRKQASPWPLIIAVGVFVLGFSVMKLIINLKRLNPSETVAGVQQSSVPQPSVASTAPAVAVAPPAQSAATSAQRSESNMGAVASAASPSAQSKLTQPEVRKAQPVGPGEVTKATSPEKIPSTEASGDTRVDIKPLRKTYIKVVVDNGSATPAYERWISPTDGIVEFHGQRIAVRVLDREAIQIRKNGKTLTEADTDVTVQ